MFVKWVQRQQSEAAEMWRGNKDKVETHWYASFHSVYFNVGVRDHSQEEIL